MVISGSFLHYILAIQSVPVESKKQIMRLFRKQILYANFFKGTKVYTATYEKSYLSHDCSFQSDVLAFLPEINVFYLIKRSCKYS